MTQLDWLGRKTSTQTHKFTFLMTNSADLDQFASDEANLSGSTLFAKAGYIRVQQEPG